MSPDPPDTGRGYSPWDVVSALQKAIRRSQAEEAVYFAVELHQSGYAAWCWARLRTIAVEDISPLAGIAADLHALEDWAKKKGRDGAGGMELVSAVLMMVAAPKSRSACWGYIRAGGDHHRKMEIPDEALDRHTRRGRALGRSHEHFFNEASKLIDCPDPERMIREFEEKAEAHARLLREMLDGRADADALPLNPIRRAATGQNPTLEKSGRLRGQLRLDPEEPRG